MGAILPDVKVKLVFVVAYYSWGEVLSAKEAESVGKNKALRLIHSSSDSTSSNN